MTITITTAPCCWGVDDVNNPNLPAWERVFDEAAAAGYGGLELGPYGYVPLNHQQVAKALTDRGLFIVAGTIFDDLVSPAKREDLLRQTDEICAMIITLPQPEQVTGQRFRTPYLTVMDWGHDERDYAAGHSDRAPRLSDGAWAGMVANIKAIAELASSKYGVRAVIHPHAGGYIEFADEIERIAIDVPAETAGFCLDTGHTYYADMDPVKTLRRYAERLDYAHFKDIDQAVFERVLGQKIRFFEACAEGVMCPIGRGVIDYPAVGRVLQEIGYHGFITVEQERDPLSVAGSLQDVKESRDYLRSVGF
ncbi:sugar phosphate isomerase/epimerase family protein [Rhizobium mongolense]|uniref:sugar phosphate isomerase/epimerase family protein n=1 Tax=Rhizobium mongolense TaxID=57676 RepID=UPI0034A418FA